MKNLNKKNISQNIQVADIAQKAGLKYEDAGLICEIAGNIEKFRNGGREKC